jgi:N-terminal domain of anti-restriction factor ArdC
MKTYTTTQRADIYTRITDRIIADLENGVRPWLRPWNAGNTAGRITLPLRHNGLPYRGINILVLWGEALDKGYSFPIWMTFKQALELNAAMRAKGVGAIKGDPSCSRPKPRPGLHDTGRLGTPTQPAATATACGTTVRAMNSSVVITWAVDTERITSVARCTSSADIAPWPTSG